MGNCSPKGAAAAAGQAKCANSIRVMMDSGRIIEFQGPKLVSEILNEFPGHGIFGQGHLSMPLLDDDRLVGGNIYYLLPNGQQNQGNQEAKHEKSHDHDQEDAGGDNLRKPVRVSSTALEFVTSITNDPASIEVLPPPRKGVWRVKLAISTTQLEEILAEEDNTEALIEQMRLAANANLTSKRPKSSRGVSLKPILRPPTSH